MSATDPQPQITQEEKRRVMENDRRVREGSTTFRSFSDAFANEGKESGRFSKLNVAPVVHPLPANSPWSGEQPQPGDEASLGININQLERDR
jgi:hypothetical protein